MHSDKVKLLRDSYPFIADDLAIDCGDGWFDILKALCDNLMKIRQPVRSYIKLSLIKQKQGILCIYYSTKEYLVDEIADFINGAINITVEASKTVCEKCGQRGELKKV